MSPRTYCRSGNELNQFSLGLTPMIVSHLSSMVITKMLAVELFDMAGGLEKSSESESSAEASSWFMPKGCVEPEWLHCFSSPGLTCALICFVLITLAKAWLAQKAQGTVRH